MVLFISGMVNGSGPEIAAAVLLWTAGGVAVYRAATSVDVRLVTRAGVAAVVLALSRPISPLWLALILVTLALLGTRKGLTELGRSRHVQLWGGIAAGASTFQLVWISIYGLQLLPLFRVEDLTKTDALRISLGRQERLLRDLIGNLNWGGAFSPPGLTVIFWVAAIGTLALAAAAFARRRVALMLVGVALACVVIPVLAEFKNYEKLGLPLWSARYTIPLAAGIPIIAGLALASERNIPESALRRLAAILAAMFIAASWVAFANDGHILTVGANGPLLPWSGHGWSPPVHLTLLDLAYLGLLIALAILAVGPVTPVRGFLNERQSPDWERDPPRRHQTPRR